MKKTGKYVFHAIISFVILLGLSVALCSCSNQGGEDGDAEQGKKKIGVSLLKENDDFYVTMKKGIVEAAEEMGYTVEVLSADNDEQKQDKNVDTLLLKKIDALVICPVNSLGVGSIIAKANDRGVPVFTADIAAAKGRVVAHIASDNYQGGMVGAEEMIEHIGTSGKVAIIHIPGTESVSQRVAGFVDTAKKAGITVLEPYLNGKDDTQESERAAQAAIMGNPDLKGIFAANDNMAFGAESAIRASGKDIVLIGYNAEPAAVEKIKKDDIWKADVIQYPYDIGKLTVETIDAYLKGELAESDETQFIPVKVGIVDVENAE
ncbi:sugar ABC transporter substrate-binding protein [bacterium]